MRNAENVFHLAIPCADLEAAKEFYVGRLGCRLARQYEDRITLDFLGDQVVCHLAPESIDREPKIYPRHFGVTFRHEREYEAFLQRVQEQEIEFFKEPFTRFPGKREAHASFFLRDPSNNLIEFKHYADPTMMY